MLGVRRLRTLALAVLFAFALSAAVPGLGSAQYVVIAQSSDTVGSGLERTEITVAAGPNPIDRFQLVRLVRPSGATKGSILFLPPLATTFAFYEQPDPSGAIGSSIAGYFALRGYDVYGYQPRYAAIPAGTCEAGLFDCSVMASWDIQSQLDDIAFIRQQIEVLHPGTKIVAGGASLGGILAVAVANDAPDDYDGVLVWEGMLASDDPAVLGLNAGYCAGVEAQLAAGQVYDGVGTNLFQEISKASDLAPGGTNILPLFPPFFTNHQVLVLLLSTPSPGPVQMPVPGYFQMAGSLASDELFFASERWVYDNVYRFASYTPNAIVRDISCSLAGVETAYVSNLAAFDGSVLAIGAGHGFGPYMPYQLSLFGTSDVTFLVEPEFGHIDHFMTPDHREVVERPVLRWLRGVFRD
jgi:pimeloyl-ACP methyl ester carboxylesterase